MTDDTVRRALNLGAGKVLMREGEEGYSWLNVDRLSLPGIDVQTDLFHYPWPWPDDYADHIEASHLVEHTPHEARRATRQLTPAECQRWRELRDLDGFFAFFAEVWRVLKMGGTITCVTPWGYADGAWQDPTHTRAILPSTLSYLSGEAQANWDYQLPLRYGMYEPLSFGVNGKFAALVAANEMTLDEVVAVAQQQLNVIHSMQWTLRKLPRLQ